MCLFVVLDFFLHKIRVLCINITAEFNLFFFRQNPLVSSVLQSNIVKKIDSQISANILGKFSIPNVLQCFLTDKKSRFINSRKSCRMQWGIYWVECPLGTSPSPFCHPLHCAVNYVCPSPARTKCSIHHVYVKAIVNRPITST